MTTKPGDDPEVFEVDLDRAAAEALRLELTRLARRFGVDLIEFRIEPAVGRPRERSA